MGIGFKMGGSGSELAFRVAAYASEAALNAAAPGDGTFGIVTTDAITGWSIQPSEPAEPALGHLWIRTGSSSRGALNALLRNRLVLYPVGAKQWTGAAWADRVGKTYLGGWKNWEEETAYLFKAWDQNPALTGGWFGTGGCLDTNGGVLDITAKVYIDTITYGAAYTLNALDLTPWKRITATVTGVDQETACDRHFAVFRVTPTGQAGESAEDIALTAQRITGAGTYTLDLSGITGAYRVGFYAKGYGNRQAAITASEVKLEKEVSS